MRRSALVVLAGALLGCADGTDDGPPGALAALGPAGPVRRVATGFGFTEGPAASRDGRMLYFSDVPNERILRLGPDGAVATFREGSRRANGLFVRADGWVVACERAAVVALSPDGSERRVLADRCDGRPFNAANDLVIDRAGGVYFTEPSFNASADGPRSALAVYYVAAPAGRRTGAGGEEAGDGDVSGDADVTRLLVDLPQPNGVLLSPDERTLYVVPSGSDGVLAYPVEAPGRLGEGRVLFRLRQPEGGAGEGGDGLTVDVRGNLYVATRAGVQVFSPAGEWIGVLRFPEPPSNTTFGGPDRRTLFVTARRSVYAVAMHVAGHVFPAGGG